MVILLVLKLTTFASKMMYHQTEERYLVWCLRAGVNRWSLPHLGGIRFARKEPTTPTFSRSQWTISHKIHPYLLVNPNNTNTSKTKPETTKGSWPLLLSSRRHRRRRCCCCCRCWSCAAALLLLIHDPRCIAEHNRSQQTVSRIVGFGSTQKRVTAQQQQQQQQHQHQHQQHQHQHRQQQQQKQQQQQQ